MGWRWGLPHEQEKKASERLGRASASAAGAAAASGAAPSRLEELKNKFAGKKRARRSSALGSGAAASGGIGDFLAVTLILAIIAFGLTTLGFLIAWRMDSTQGFHAIMNLVLIPMWLLSGAFFPATGASGWLRLLMTLNPLTYGMAALRRCLYPAGAAVGPDVPGLGFAIVVTVGFAIVAFWIARAQASRPLDVGLA